MWLSTDSPMSIHPLKTTSRAYAVLLSALAAPFGESSRLNRQKRHVVMLQMSWILRPTSNPTKRHVGLGHGGFSQGLHFVWIIVKYKEI